MGQSRRERTWARPRSTRHAWVELGRKHPAEPPVPALVLSWRRGGGGVWEALCVMVDDDAAGDPVLMQRWVPAGRIRPVETDPNRAFGLR